MINQEIFKYRIQESGSNILEVEGLPKGTYDKQAVQYDKLISNALYNRIMWANTTTDYEDFCKMGLNESDNGIIADIGCGTLSFTYKAYAKNCNKNIYLCDLSLEMIKLGKQKIEKIIGINSNINYLRSDALDMPFKDNTIQTVFSFGIFHIFDEPQKLIKEINRILMPGGKVFISSLCTDRKFSGKYLNILHKNGHVAKTLSSVEIIKIIEDIGFEIVDFKVKGGMAYVFAKKPLI